MEMLLKVNIHIKIIRREYFRYSKCVISNSAFVKHQCIVLNRGISATDMEKYYLRENRILNNNYFYHSFYWRYTSVYIFMVSFLCNMQIDCQFRQFLKCWQWTEILGKNRIRKREQIQTLPPQKKQAEAFYRLYAKNRSQQSLF